MRLVIEMRQGAARSVRDFKKTNVIAAIALATLVLTMAAQAQVPFQRFYQYPTLTIDPEP
jgi:hypothetical protein